MLRLKYLEKRLSCSMAFLRLAQISPRIYVANRDFQARSWDLYK